jgi:hypothetical protein
MKKSLVVVLAAQISAGLTVAYAQDAADLTGCQSVEGNYCVASGGPISLQGVTGDISIIRNASTTAVSTGAVLLAGDRVVSQDGSALLVLAPQCKIKFSSFSSSMISTSAGLTCASLGSSTMTTDSATGSAGNVLAGAATLGAIGGALSLQNNHTSTSP